jgi:hypothetical protein
MTRGMKGCHIYCTDPETQEYFKNLGNKSNTTKYNVSSDGASFNFDKSDK